MDPAAVAAFEGLIGFGDHTAFGTDYLAAGNTPDLQVLAAIVYRLSTDTDLANTDCHNCNRTDCYQLSRTD